MATLGSFDYPDELLADCSLSVAQTRRAADLITAYADDQVTAEDKASLRAAANVLRFLAADTNEAMSTDSAGA